MARRVLDVKHEAENGANPLWLPSIELSNKDINAYGVLLCVADLYAYSRGQVIFLNLYGYQ